VTEKTLCNIFLHLIVNFRKEKQKRYRNRLLNIYSNWR